MQSHRLGHVRSEMPREPGRAEALMLRIDTAIRDVLRQVMNQMADIVQQGRRDQRWRRACALRAQRALQGVLKLRDALAISVVAVAREGRADLVQRAHSAASRALVT